MKETHKSWAVAALVGGKIGFARIDQFALYDLKALVSTRARGFPIATFQTRALARKAARFMRSNGYKALAVPVAITITNTKKG